MAPAKRTKDKTVETKTVTTKVAAKKSAAKKAPVPDDEATTTTKPPGRATKRVASKEEEADDKPLVTKRPTRGAKKETPAVTEVEKAAPKVAAKAKPQKSAAATKEATVPAKKPAATKRPAKAATKEAPVPKKKPAPKKGKKAAAEPIDEQETKAVVDEDVAAAAPKKSRAAKGGKATTSEKPVENDHSEDEETPAPAKVTKAPSKNVSSTVWENIDFECKECTEDKGGPPNLSIISWNVDGIRAWLKKGGLEILKQGQPDILCLQEIKCSVKKLPEELNEVEGYKVYWFPAKKDGYSGVGILCKTMPIEVIKGIGSEDHDEEGRCITAEFKNFFLVNVYVPNAGRGLVTLDKKLDWNKSFKDFIKSLEVKKPVIICGDMNVAHTEIDLSNPKTNQKNAGFTPEERDGMTNFLESGYVDSFRHLYPDSKDNYTFWTYIGNCRSKNVGWRLDYFLVSEKFMSRVCDNVILDKVFGSDHCPILLHLKV